MVFKISHSTYYTYSEEVFFEPHYFRFKPKNTPHSVLKKFDIQIEPESTGVSEQIDIENNHILLCWFDGLHKNLRIKTQSIIESEEFNPFNFIVHPSVYLKIPFEYDNVTKQLLKPALYSEINNQKLHDYCSRILKRSSNQSLDFFVQLTTEIHDDFDLQTRETGSPLQPHVTFDEKSGSCRDLAWMQIHMMRQFGIASRFVSGYFYVDNENPEFELHAWTEVYLPGAGWIGLDPSHGILTGAYHIPIASSAFHENTMPVSGAVRGKATSELNHELDISLES